jgi:hypothetical protein
MARQRAGGRRQTSTGGSASSRRTPQSMAGQTQLDFNSAAASTRAQADAIHPANTRKAYDSKTIEIMRFCDVWA